MLSAALLNCCVPGTGRHARRAGCFRGVTRAADDDASTQSALPCCRQHGRDQKAVSMHYAAAQLRPPTCSSRTSIFGDPGPARPCQARHHGALHSRRHQDDPAGHEPARSHHPDAGRTAHLKRNTCRVHRWRSRISSAATARHAPGHAGHISLGQLKVMSAIESCRTAALGGHVARCEEWPTAKSRTIVAAIGTARSARARRQRTGWRRARPICCRCRTNHVVFTLPATIAESPSRTKAAIYDLLFKASAETLVTIAADPKHLGARVGITSVLHTWGSAMTHHPHVHMIVPGVAASRSTASAGWRAGPASSCRWAAISFSRNNRRKQAREHRTGRKKPGRHATQRSPSSEIAATRHDHVDMRVMCHGRTQVWRTEVMPTRAPRCFGSAAMVTRVSAEALNSRS